MGSEPLKLNVDGWTLEVSINDHGTQLAMHTNDANKTVHYVRLKHKQADELQRYLYMNVPYQAA